MQHFLFFWEILFFLSKIKYHELWPNILNNDKSRKYKDWLMWWMMSILDTEKVKDPVKNYATEADGRVTKYSVWVMNTI